MFEIPSLKVQILISSAHSCFAAINLMRCIKSKSNMDIFSCVTHETCYRVTHPCTVAHVCFSRWICADTQQVVNDTHLHVKHHHTLYSRAQTEVSFDIASWTNAAKGDSASHLTEYSRSLKGQEKQLWHCSTHQMSQWPWGRCDWQGTLSGGIRPLVVEERTRLAVVSVEGNRCWSGWDSTRCPV